MSKKVFLKGTLILACTGLVSRIAGFFYRIFLSHAIGAEGLGLYQLILPLQGLMAALSYTGIQSALSRLIASRLALQEKKEAYFSLVTGIFAAVFFSAVTGFLLFRHADFFASTILKAPGTSDLLRLTAASIPLCAIHSCIDSYYYARKKASVPAAVQLSEQAVRIGATYILYLIFLSEGRPVISSQRAGLFTSGGHFIVLRGVTANGKVLVNDPNDSDAKNYINREFDMMSEIHATANAYWIFDKK